MDYVKLGDTGLEVSRICLGCVTAPIAGATRRQHLDDAVAAPSVRLSPGELAELEGAYVPHAVVGHR